MKNAYGNSGKGLTGRRTLLGLFAMLALALLIAAACGEAATATPEPTAAMEEEAMPEPTAMMEEDDHDADEGDAMPEPTPTAMMEEDEEEDAMEETGLRPRSEWTVENPATREEIEAELAQYRGHSLVFASWGGAYQSAQRQAYGIPFEDQFGIEVIDDGTPLLGRVRAMEASGNITWHVFDQGTGTIHNLGRNGSLEELDLQRN